MPVRSIHSDGTSVTIRWRDQERTFLLSDIPGDQWNEQRLALAAERINQLLPEGIKLENLRFEDELLRFSLTRVR